jgi:hypothetical protein
MYVNRDSKFLDQGNMSKARHEILANGSCLHINGLTKSPKNDNLIRLHCRFYILQVDVDTQTHTIRRSCGCTALWKHIFRWPSRIAEVS